MAHWTHLRRRHAFQTNTYVTLIAITFFFTAVFHAQQGKRVQHTSKGLTSSTSRLLVTTSCNYGQKEILANFACNIRRICPSRAPVVCSLDRETHAFAATLGLSSVLAITGKGQNVTVTNFGRDGSILFDGTNKGKVTTLMVALKSGLHVLHSNANTIWCRDAGTFLEHLMDHEPYRDADVLIQADAAYRSLNSGFFLIRSNPRTLELFSQLSKRVANVSSNQDVMSKIFCDEEYGGRKIHERYGDVPFWCESHGVVLRVLPTQLFPTGAERYDRRNVFAHSREELSAMCTKGKFVILRNNLIPASKEKARLIRKGFWHVKFNGLDEPKCGSKPVRDSTVAAQTCGLFC